MDSSGQFAVFKSLSFGQGFSCETIDSISYKVLPSTKAPLLLNPNPLKLCLLFGYSDQRCQCWFRHCLVRYVFLNSAQMFIMILPKSFQNKMTAHTAVVSAPGVTATAGAWFFPWLVAAITYYNSVSIKLTYQLRQISSMISCLDWLVSLF